MCLKHGSRFFDISDEEGRYLSPSLKSDELMSSLNVSLFILDLKRQCGFLTVLGALNLGEGSYHIRSSTIWDHSLEMPYVRCSGCQSQLSIASRIWQIEWYVSEVSWFLSISSSIWIPLSDHSWCTWSKESFSRVWLNFWPTEFMTCNKIHSFMPLNFRIVWLWSNSNLNIIAVLSAI